MQAFYLILISLSAVMGQARKQQHGRRHSHPEPFSNDTLDQLITKAYGGLDSYHKIQLSENGLIRAELDMMLTWQQYILLYRLHPKPTRLKKRKAVRSLIYRWIGNVVPYEFKKGDFTRKEIHYIKEAMADWQKRTCLKFRPAAYHDKNRIRFETGKGCNSALGMSGGAQSITLQNPGCRYKGLYLHEIGHAIGLVHEHQLPDRDEHIEILYGNIDMSMIEWFSKYSYREINHYGVPYDYSSIMHYGVTAFSKDGRPTIRLKDPSKNHLIGQVWRKGLSFSDVKIVNLMYNCAAHCSPKLRCTGVGFLDKRCRCVCPYNSKYCRASVISDSTNKATIRKQKYFTFYDKCRDKNSRCRKWKRYGECLRNPSYMNRYCKKSCNFCEGDCRDEREECSKWANRGECKRNLGYMKIHCQKSCLICYNGNQTRGNHLCKDKKKYCRLWRRKGYCTGKYERYMRINCPFVCRYCQ